MSRSQLGSQARIVMLATGILVVASVGALTSKPAASPAPQSATAGTPTVAGLPGTRGPGAHLSWSLNEWCSTRMPSAVVAAQLARYTDVIVVCDATQLGPVGQPGGYVSVMRQANANLHLYYYVNSMTTWKPAGTFPNDWYLHNRSGAVVTTSWGGTTLTVMNPTGSTPYQGFANWADYLARGVCQATIQRERAATFDGCWFDVEGTYSRDKAANGPPVIPGKTSTFTAAQWFALTGKVSERARQILSASVLVNGLQDGNAYYSNNSQFGPTSGLLNYADGAMAEGWLKPHVDASGVSAPMTSWSNNVQMIIDANTNTQSGQHHAVQVIDKPWAGGGLTGQGHSMLTASQNAQWRDFSYASFLLANSGAAYYEYASAHDNVTPYTDPFGPIVSPRPYEMATQLGTAVDNQSSVDGYRHSTWSQTWYERDFTNGKVLVNPMSTTANVSLSGTYLDAAGAQVSSVRLAPYSGAIVVKATVDLTSLAPATPAPNPLGFAASAPPVMPPGATPELVGPTRRLAASSGVATASPAVVQLANARRSRLTSTTLLAAGVALALLSFALVMRRWRRRQPGSH